MGMELKVNSFHDIWGQPDNEHISISGYGINISIFRNIKIVKLSEFFFWKCFQAELFSETPQPVIFPGLVS